MLPYELWIFTDPPSIHADEQANVKKVHLHAPKPRNIIAVGGRGCTGSKVKLGVTKYVQSTDKKAGPNTYITVVSECHFSRGVSDPAWVVLNSIRLGISFIQGGPSTRIRTSPNSR